MGRAEEIFERVKNDGVAAIDEFILNRQSEELFLDFKRSADNGRGPRTLHATDRENLAKAISGFGNSEGGVIVWGVDASVDLDGADVARAKVPIENVIRFKSWIEGSVSGRTVPAHPGVQNHAIDIGEGRGFVTTLIPKSEVAPHQSVFDLRYYMRAGSSFLPVTHSVLAGMFGRRPQPTIFANFAYTAPKIEHRPDANHVIRLTQGFKIYNKGPILVRDLYSDIRLMLPDGGCTASFDPNTDDWSGRMHYGMWLSLVTKDDFKLAPESFTQPFVLNLELAPPFDNGKFWLQWTYGCDGSPLRIMEVEHSLAEIETLYQKLFSRSPEYSTGSRFIREVFKLPQEKET